METPFEKLGGEAGTRALADRFYELMDTIPEAAGIRAMHPADLTESRDKFYWFLCGWLGGPNHYVQRFGHPRLRARHLPFPIASAEAQQWLLCMLAALQDCVEDEALRERLFSSFTQVAAHMRNREDPPESDDQG